MHNLTDEYEDCMIEKFRLFDLDPKQFCIQTYDNDYHGLIDPGIDTKDIVGHFTNYYHQKLIKERNCNETFERDYFA